MLNGIFTQTHEFPGKENIPSIVNLRSIVNGSEKESFGAGFLHKLSGSDFKNRAINHYGIILILQGSGEYITKNGYSIPLKKGMVFQRRPNIIHSNIINSGEPWFEAFLALGTQMYKALTAIKIINPNKVIIAEHIDIHKQNQMVRQFYSLAQKIYNIDETDLLPFLTGELTILHEIIKKKDPEDIFTRYCSTINENLEDPTNCKFYRPNLSEFCKSEGVGYEWFRKRFKEEKKVTPVVYAIKQRQVVAQRILRTTNYPIYQIAEQLGYKNSYEFSAQFKKYIGVSPTTYRIKATF